VHFLETSRRGYCEQFAGTMAVLVRALGYPARVALGFTAGDRDESGRFRVTTSQVHAWPEVHFGEYGWLAFEPTPGRSNPSASYLLPPALRSPGRGPGDDGESAGNSASGVEQREAFRDAPATIAPLPAPATGRGDRSVVWSRLLLVALAVALALAAIIAPGKAIARHLALRRAGDARGRVLAAYAWLLEGADDLGLGRRTGETPREYRARVLLDDVPQDAAERITGLAAGALYSPRDPDEREADAAVGAAREILRSLRRRAGALRLLRAALRPAASR
jgi:hypothetical protein